MANGFLREKALTVYVANEGGKNIVYVTDGHNRLRGAKRAIQRGAEIAVLPVINKAAGTTVEDLVVGLAVANSGRPLSPIEKAAVCKRLVGFGMEVKEIARRLTYTVGYVNDLLLLIGAPKKIRSMVETGGISAANATSAIKKHGDKAADVLGEKLETAKASGKTKITQAAIKPKAPNAKESFQNRVKPWMLECFGEEIAADKGERNHRFLEESLELVQSCGCTQDEAHQLVDYVYGRQVGEPSQEVGGVMVTLAALCLAQSLDMHADAEAELARIWTKVDQIRAKQAAKPKHSPLPGPSL